MELVPFNNTDELIKFLKIDYPNNLYFFTYLNGSLICKPENKVLIGKINGKIVIALLLTPVHCSISSLSIDYIGRAAKHIPPIDSLHVVGRSDYVEKLLSIAKGPERDQHEYSLCQLPVGSASNNPRHNGTGATHADLRELVQFYNNNDMLYDAKGRLPGILNWGRVHYVRYNGKIVSCALTTTETDDAAMIGAVFTSPEHVNRGYASSCIMGLCWEFIKQKKTPYLFYRTEDLHLERLYKRLGFEKIGNWVLATISQ